MDSKDDNDADITSCQDIAARTKVLETESAAHMMTTLGALCVNPCDPVSKQAVSVRLKQTVCHQLGYHIQSDLPGAGVESNQGKEEG